MQETVSGTKAGIEDAELKKMPVRIKSRKKRLMYYHLS